MKKAPALPFGNTGAQLFWRTTFLIYDSGALYDGLLFETSWHQDISELIHHAVGYMNRYWLARWFLFSLNLCLHATLTLQLYAALYDITLADDLATRYASNGSISLIIIGLGHLGLKVPKS